MPGPKFGCRTPNRDTLWITGIPAPKFNMPHRMTNEDLRGVLPRMPTRKGA